MNQVALDLIAEMQKIHAIVETLRGKFYATSDAKQKKEIQLSMNLWAKDMDALVSKLLEATK